MLTRLVEKLMAQIPEVQDIAKRGPAPHVDTNPIRTAICRIMSEMLDNPDEHGIYPTTKFMDQMECYIQRLIGRVVVELMVAQVASVNPCGKPKSSEDDS
jgi:hypothetical protein